MPAQRFGRFYRFDLDEVREWLRRNPMQPGVAADDYRAGIKRLVDSAPPLTAEQADRIRAILTGGAA
ncbi:hypothetical protein GPOL_c31930 [Gordonia polyisoprenivorans VH2]|uniref:Uncharacterized protein n=2 Tax=Gordonia polyisoprenivorans TaxID=84595 RepID=H6MX90_GORPV|nr:hypothetical protein GPOL_c31930 [Gordonia polyisoprenivorans VH2]